MLKNIRLYLDRQASSLLRYLYEQTFLTFLGWIPTVVGIGVRAVLYRFILQMDDKLVDASVRRDLNDVKAQFQKNIYVSEMFN